jgi:hypothetical protein
MKQTRGLRESTVRNSKAIRGIGIRTYVAPAIRWAMIASRFSAISNGCEGSLRIAVKDFMKSSTSRVNPNSGVSTTFSWTGIGNMY